MTPGITMDDIPSQNMASLPLNFSLEKANAAIEEMRRYSTTYVTAILKLLKNQRKMGTL